MSTNNTQTVLVATCLYGLEAALTRDIRDRLSVEAQRHWCEAVFTFGGDPARLAGLRIAQNVFVQFDSFPIGRTMPDLAQLDQRLRQLPAEDWFRQCGALSGAEPDSADISVSVKRKGEHNFSYKDLEQRALDILPEATARRVVLDPRPLELRIDVDGDHCRLLGRLTPTPLSHRAYKRYRAPNETEPTIAAAMVRYSQPEPGDAVLDPFCGTGTIPIEEAAYGQAGRIVAGELNAKRIAWAAANAQLARADVLLARWDGLRLPFRSRSFQRVITAPPQSDPRSGRPWRGRDFSALVAESLRVLDYRGRAVWLLRHDRLLKIALKQDPHARIAQRRICNWKGKQWSICVLKKEL